MKYITKIGVKPSSLTEHSKAQWRSGGRNKRASDESLSVVGSRAEVMIGRNVSMDVKRDLRNSILLPTLTYGSEKWTWNGAQ